MLYIFTDKQNDEWWFVKKNLSEERGWVPAQGLMDAVTYTQYVQTKLNEKIDKLPVFESMYYLSFINKKQKLKKFLNSLTLI